MPTFAITAPDGRKYRVTGDTADGAYAALQQHLGNQAQPEQKAENGPWTKFQKPQGPWTRFQKQKQPWENDPMVGDGNPQGQQPWENDPLVSDGNQQGQGEVSLQRLEQGLRNADAAGDTQAARVFAAEIRKRQAAAPSGNNNPPEADPRNSFMGKVDSAMRGAADMMSFGYADELAAGGDALFNPIFGTGSDGQSFSERYNANLDTQRGIDKADAENRSGYRFAGQVGGALTGGAGLAKSGLSVGSRAVQAGAPLWKVAPAFALDAGVTGALSGSGRGTNADERMQYALTDGTIGAAVGGLLPVAGAAISKSFSPITNPIRAWWNPEEAASNALGTAVRRSGMSVDDIAASLRSAADDGQTEFAVADAMGQAGQRMLSTTVRNPNNSRQAIHDALMGRQSGQAERLTSFLADGLEATDTAAQRAARLTAERAASANANYAAARNSAGAVDPTAAISRADEFLAPGASGVMSNSTGIADDSIEAAVRKARSFLTDGKSVVSDFGSAFRSKQEIDALIERASPTVQRQLIPIRDELDNALVQASEPYANARNVFRQQSRAIDAVDQGKTAASSRMRADDTIPAFARMDPAEQSAFRAGYADPLIARIEAASSSPMTNKARLVTTTKLNKELPAFAAPGKAGQLSRRIGREETMFRTAHTALGGSKTADNLADAADMAGLDAGVVTAYRQGGWPRVVGHMFTRAVNGASGMNSGVVERIGNGLMETDPQRAAAMLNKSLQRLSKKDLVRAMLLGASVNAGQRGTSAAVDNFLHR